ncbi:MAG TPA: penicillin-binding transpeptidase domain-containing protein [Usitatibacter sp.]|nr:penicillin-binding transpeptidase domain-containing protein [Usitatibacter sp.]
MDRLSTSLLALFTGLGASAAETVAMPRWQRHFDAQGVKGTFVLFEPLEDRYRVLDAARAERRYLPASTFKIPNALIGLEVGSIADENEVFRWDGKPKPVCAWERDHTLDTGMQANAVWMFQEVARRTGKARMREWLDRLEYGNRDLAGGIELFWLQGGLRVSAMEQVRFLHRLAEGRLPMTQRAQRLVRRALAVDRTRACTLYAKAGTASCAKEAVAWWVGWVERKGRPQAFFAMNFTPGPATAPGEQVEVGRGVLREAGVL